MNPTAVTLMAHQQLSEFLGNHRQFSQLKMELHCQNMHSSPQVYILHQTGTVRVYTLPEDYSETTFVLRFSGYSQVLHSLTRHYYRSFLLECSLLMLALLGQYMCHLYANKSFASHLSALQMNKF
ncbi:hypothetical protein OUZ56_020819 [Daphnia magna]|uniref:Uncharacterized protein n=1 Tax=Daphnia magna TaxID=35525 RepID=A0ABQ9ZFK0_9CRUS|nr:hypothetical protein OUZ56_020819 [Daphnia magna]